MARSHTMTPKRRAALKKAQLASARKRRGKGKGKLAAANRQIDIAGRRRRSGAGRGARLAVGLGTAAALGTGLYVAHRNSGNIAYTRTGKVIGGNRGLHVSGRSKHYKTGFGSATDSYASVRLGGRYISFGYEKKNGLRKAQRRG